MDTDNKETCDDLVEDFPEYYKEEDDSWVDRLQDMLVATCKILLLEEEEMAAKVKPLSPEIENLIQRLVAKA